MNDPLLTQPLLTGLSSQVHNASDSQRDAILLTGGTGFVGTYCIGEIMRQNPDVHVFAVVRGGKKWRLASQEFPKSVAGSELGEEDPADFNPVYGHELPKGWPRKSFPRVWRDPSLARKTQLISTPCTAMSSRRVGLARVSQECGGIRAWRGRP